MKILVEEQHDLPIAEVQVVTRVGPSADPEGQEGLARHAFELMRRGAGGRSRAELDASFDALGAQVELVTSHDGIGLAVTCLERNLDATVALLGDVILRPHLQEDEHARLVREGLASLDEVRDDDPSLCQRFFERLALAGSPYGRSALGTERSLGRLTRADAEGWVARAIVGPDLIVGFAGDVSRARAEELAAGAFGAVPDRAAAASPRFTAPLPHPRRTYLVDKPERAQSQILIGHAAPPSRHEDFLALHVGATAFGGTFTSPLVREVRVKRGWSYGVGIRTVRTRGGHSLRMRVFPSAEQTPDTLRLIFAMWQEAVGRGLAAEDVAHAQGYLEGSWAFEIDTAGERLDRRVEALLQDLPEDHAATFVARLRALDADAVNAAVRRHWRPDQATCVVTATAETMLARLEPEVTGPLEVVDYRSY
jgi:zinc protease